MTTNTKLPPDLVEVILDSGDTVKRNRIAIAGEGSPAEARAQELLERIADTLDKILFTIQTTMDD